MNLVNILEATIDKTSQLDPGIGALYSLVAIVLVFAILLIIIGVTTLVYKIMGLFDMKKELDESKKAKTNEAKDGQTELTNKGPVEIKDDDMMAAVLVATIDYRNEVKKDVHVISVREVK